MGCHQTNAAAGFHVFGFDDDDASPLNRVAVPASAHFEAERPRRAAYLRDLAAGRPPRLFRPLPDAPAGDWSGDGPPRPQPAGLGMACRSGAAVPSCAPGLVCRSIMTAADGLLETSQCLPQDGIALSGLPCFSGRLVAARAPFRDRVTDARSLGPSASTPGGARLRCLSPRIGVPGGLVDRPCTPGETFADGTLCALGGSRAFDVCTQSGDFAACLADAVSRAERQSCDRQHPCREDYICQALPAEFAGGTGGGAFCTPTYFLFQMRIDGHVSPL